VPVQRSVFIVSAAVLGGVLAGVLAGCSGEDITEAVLENRIEAAADGEVDIDLSEGAEGEIRIETADGTFTAGSTTELPDDFPDAVPTPPGALVNVSRLEADGALSFTLTYETDDDVTPETWEAYRAELEAAGFTTEFEATDGSGVTAQLTDGTWSVLVTGSFAGDPAGYALVVAPVA
jgi:hypothetical protein